MGEKIIDLELVNNRKMRDNAVSRVEVLDKVKSIILLDGTDFATTKQVADYYEVSIDVIKQQVSSNREEIMSDGVLNLSGRETKQFLVSKNISPTNFKGYFEANNQRFANRNNLLFPKRAILRVGMLLRDSLIAKEVRTQLLNIVHDTEVESPKIIDNVIDEIDEEKKIMLAKVEAMYNGDLEEMERCNARLFALKNKRITQLEDENQLIQEHSLTIDGAREVINKIVRTMGMKHFGYNFGEAWNKLYSFINTKLKVNVRSRAKHRKVKVLLDVLTEEELFEVEKISRAWAYHYGIDVGEIVSLMNNCKEGVK